MPDFCALPSSAHRFDWAWSASLASFAAKVIRARFGLWCEPVRIPDPVRFPRLRQQVRTPSRPHACRGQCIARSTTGLQPGVPYAPHKITNCVTGPNRAIVLRPSVRQKAGCISGKFGNIRKQTDVRCHCRSIRIPKLSASSCTAVARSRYPVTPSPAFS